MKTNPEESDAATWGFEMPWGLWFFGRTKAFFQPMDCRGFGEMRAGMTKALGRALDAVLNNNKHALAENVFDELRNWAAKDANPEGLVDWLERGGWKDVDGDKVEAALVEACRANRAAARAAYAGVPKSDETEPYLPAEMRAWATKQNNYCAALSAAYYVWTEPREVFCAFWSVVEPFSWFFDTARADREKPEVQDRLARFVTPYTVAKEELLSLLPNEPDRAAKPPPPTMLLGYDALKAGLKSFEWGNLVSCLPLEPAAANDWLYILAKPWIEERAASIESRIEIRAAAVEITLRPKAETAAGKWTPMPRVMSVASALGGPFSVDVDGETYAPEPELAGPAALALRPRGVDIVPADWLGKPAQLSLALDLDTPPDAVLEYLGAVVESATRTAHLAKLPNICPKLLGLMFAAAPMTGSMVQGTLGELARMLYPDWTRNHRSTRDLQGVGAAMMAVKGLRLVETEPDGTRRPYELFIVDMALTANPDAVLGWTINPWLVKRMQKGKGGGFFLLNMTRWLALGIQNPRLFPLALRLAALWDAARVRNGPFDPARLRPIEADRLAWECNTLPEGAAMYRTKQTDAGAAKLALTTARAKLESDLDALREAGLLGPWKKTKVYGRGFNVLPTPPADYTEACKRAAQAIRKVPGKRKG